MHKILLFLGLLFAAPLIAQSTGPFVLTATTSPCAQIATADRYATVGIQVSGTFSATLQPSVTIQGQPAANTTVIPVASTTPQGTITAAGTYLASVAGVSTFQVCASAFVSGTATVWLNVSSGISAKSVVAAGGGVVSFNGRTGAVVSQAGDFTVAQITGAAALTETPSPPNGTFPVLFYGAVCDGVTDDAPAFNAALAAASNGGTILVPATANGCFLASTFTVPTDGISIKGAAWALGTLAPSRMIFAAGVSGIVASGSGFATEDLNVSSQSVGAGADVGITVTSLWSRIVRTQVNGFGSHGIFLNSTTTAVDNWYMENTTATNNFGDGIRIGGGTTAIAGTCVQCSAFGNTLFGIDLLSTAAGNTFVEPHSGANAGGAYDLVGRSNNFVNAFCDVAAVSSFTFDSTTNNNRVSFPNNGQCTTITNSGASRESNIIQYNFATFQSQSQITIAPEDPSTGTGHAYRVRSGVAAVNDLDVAIDNTLSPGTLLQFNFATPGWQTSYPIRSLIATGTAPFPATSTTVNPNLNAALLNGNTFPAPGAIGGTTPAAGSFTALKGSTFASTTNCAAIGTAANPSVVTCAAAPAGAFSCATNASTGTCQVNTTAVTTNSRIFVQQTDADATNIGVTCNTGLTVSATAPLLASKVNGASFTINLGTVSVNPACFIYFIIN